VKKDDEGNPCSSDDARQVEVLMISTPNRADMVFPKVTAARISIQSSSRVSVLWNLNMPVLWQGGWEDDEDVYQAACREAMEEAGVKGIINVSSTFLSVPSFSCVLAAVPWHSVTSLNLHLILEHVMLTYVVMLSPGMLRDKRLKCMNLHKPIRCRC
jgi:hypothetical protein